MSKNSLKTLFITKSKNGWYCLREILQNHPDYKVKAIITLPPPKKIRTVSGYKDPENLAKKYHIPLIRTTDVRLDLIRKYSPEIIFVIGWPRLIKKEIIDFSKLGVIGMHPTLLPKGRGRAPIPWTIIKGLKGSGVTMFYLDEGVDSGDIIGQKKFKITLADNAQTVYNKAVKSMIWLLKKYLPLIRSGKAPRTPQDHRQATYYSIRKAEDGLIDWNQDTLSIYNWIRALTKPYPGAFCFYQRKKNYIWRAKLSKNNLKGRPSEILKTGKNNLLIATKKGYLKIFIDNIKSPPFVVGELLK